MIGGIRRAGGLRAAIAILSLLAACRGREPEQPARAALPVPPPALAREPSPPVPGTAPQDAPPATAPEAAPPAPAAAEQEAAREPGRVRPPDTAPPSAPQQLVAETRPGEIGLRWEPSRDDVGVAGYEVLQSGTAVATVKTGAWVARGLRAGIEQCFAVRAFDTAGNRSEPSAAACGTPPDVTPPSTPAEIVASASVETQVEVRWSPSTDDVGVVGYEVGWGGAVLARTEKPGMVQAGLRAGQRYCYEVVALDAAGNRSARGGPACATTPDLTPPAPPGHLTARAESDVRVALEWSAATDNVGVAGYQVWRGGRQVADVPASTAWSETGLRPAVEYCYTVRAVDAAGNASAPSPRSCATTPDLLPPTVPGNLLAAARSSAQVLLAWGPSTDDVGVAGYEVLREDEVVLTGAHRRVALTGLEPLTEHCYTVRAFDAAGNRSKPSAPACARTADPSQPVGPDNLRAERAAADELQLRWDPSPSPGVSYVVYWDGGRRTPGSPSPRTVSVGSTSLTRFKIFGPPALEHHCYRVTATGEGSRESPPSLPVCTSVAEAVGVR